MVVRMVTYHRCLLSLIGPVTSWWRWMREAVCSSMRWDVLVTVLLQLAIVGFVIVHVVIIAERIFIVP